MIHVIEPLDERQCLGAAGSETMPALNESAAILEGTGRKNMANRSQQKKAYVPPRVVDFGAIEATTGDCLGLCLDGEHLGLYGLWPPLSQR